MKQYISAGDLIIFTGGEYEDFTLHTIVKAETSFVLTEKLKEYQDRVQKSVANDEHDILMFIYWLVGVGLASWVRYFEARYSGYPSAFQVYLDDKEYDPLHASFVEVKTFYSPPEVWRGHCWFPGCHQCLILAANQKPEVFDWHIVDGKPFCPIHWVQAFKAFNAWLANRGSPCGA